MDTRLKHRIVGSLVLLALAVIFLPELLDGDKAYRQPNFAPMPTNPVSASTSPEVVFLEPEPQPKAAKADPTPPDTQEQGEANAQATTHVNAAPQIEEDTEAGDTRLTQYKKNAWVIQLGVFGNRENVIKLVTQLRKQGYTTFTKPAQPEKGQITRVYVGPDLSKAKLIKMLPKLKEKTNLQGKIYPYNPLIQ